MAHDQDGLLETGERIGIPVLPTEAPQLFRADYPI